MSACDACLARAWLLARLAGHLDRVGDRIWAVLALGDEELTAAVAGRDAETVVDERAGFSADLARDLCIAAGLEAVCRCEDVYPARLRSLAAPPAVLHVAGGLRRLGELAEAEPVAVVGARRASPYAMEAARSLSRALGVAGLTVVSGMAAGVDTAAHEGALAAGGATIAVLAAGADRPYPATARALHRRIRAEGAAISELGPGVPVRRWMFPARNRIIAGLSAMTVVVAARRGSGSLLTAIAARELGREVGAVPGQITAPLAWGPHRLLRGGARLVTGADDVLEALFGPAAPSRAVPARRPSLAPELERLLEAIADGHEPDDCLRLAGLDADRGLAAIASLELAGLIRRAAGGRVEVIVG